MNRYRFCVGRNKEIITFKDGKLITWFWDMPEKSFHKLYSFIRKNGEKYPDMNVWIMDK